MADGSRQPIKDVAEGDEVAATDPETGQTESREVVDLHSNLDTELTDLTVAVGSGQIGEVLQTTQNHPFWSQTRQEWVDAAELLSGEQLRTTDGTEVTVTSVHNFTGTKVMRDLTVDTTHTYYVLAGQTPVLVHNCGELADVAANLPKDWPRRSTGILDVGVEQVPLSSGPGGPSQLVANLPGRTAQNFDHVETHAAAFLQSNPHIRKAVLYVQNGKNSMCGGPNGCAANLNDMLPEGTQLWVYMNGNPLQKFTGNAR